MSPSGKAQEANVDLGHTRALTWRSGGDRGSHGSLISANAELGHKGADINVDVGNWDGGHGGEHHGALLAANVDLSHKGLDANVDVGGVASGGGELLDVHASLDLGHDLFHC
jgi:hypothetical protein